jgi:hypothetical protein
LLKENYYFSFNPQLSQAAKTFDRIANLAAQLLAEFLQEAEDFGDLHRDLEAGAHVKAAFRMSALLQRIEDAGFLVFGGREVQRLEGGIGAPEAWPVAILYVRRPTSPEIIKVCK